MRDSFDTKYCSTIGCKTSYSHLSLSLGTTSPSIISLHGHRCHQEFHKAGHGFALIAVFLMCDMPLSYPVHYTDKLSPLALFQVHMRCCVSSTADSLVIAMTTVVMVDIVDGLANSSSLFRRILESSSLIIRQVWIALYGSPDLVQLINMTGAYQNLLFFMFLSVVSLSDVCTLFVMVVSALLALIFGPINTGLLASWHYLLQ